MSKDYERLPESGEAFIYVAMGRLMVRRLARSLVFSDSFEVVFSEVGRSLRETHIYARLEYAFYV
jgi:hypothetical protein